MMIKSIKSLTRIDIVVLSDSKVHDEVLRVNSNQ